VNSTWVGRKVSTHASLHKISASSKFLLEKYNCLKYRGFVVILNVIFGLFVLNSKSFNCNNGFV
jgi:hypothetical protein